MTEPFTWHEPEQKLFSESGILNFKISLAYGRLKNALAIVIEKVKGQDILIKDDASLATKLAFDNSPTAERPHVNYLGVLSLLEKLTSSIDQHPPISGPRRFGNMACRHWHQELEDSAPSLLLQHITVPGNLDHQGFLKELQSYLLNSFGSKTRLDYGTGHELSFLAFLGALMLFNVLPPHEITGTQMLHLWVKYYQLVKRLITEYNLEPAGSHGVWGLDDHFHLIYILGAAQFVDNRNAPPVSLVLSEHVRRSQTGHNLYLQALAFIFEIKKGPFREHSPQLNSIQTSVHLWSKMLQGLLKMYDVEVFGKFPVMQHFRFGGVLYPWIHQSTHRPLPIANLESTRFNNPGSECGVADSRSVRPVGLSEPRTRILNIDSLASARVSPQKQSTTFNKMHSR